MISSTLHNDAPRRRPHRDARRLYLVGCGLFAALALLVVRLVMIQVVDADLYAETARRQYESKIVLQSERGTLYDRNGHLLASNSVSISFAVDPTIVENPQRIATAFARVFGGKVSEWLRRVKTPNTSFVWLRRKVAGPQREALKDLKDEGLIRQKEPLRHFEYASLGSQVVGATDIDNNGLSGIELYYDEALRGIDGYMVMQRDAHGRRRPDIDMPKLLPEHGSGLVLTLDITMQSIVEDELRKGVEHASASSGTALAIDPATGEILAIASWPTYDANNVGGAPPEAIRVRAVTDIFEPGSTMKVVTAAAALEEGVVDPTETIDAENGVYELAGHVIRDDHASGLITFREALERSSNIVMAKVASRIPRSRFYKYVRDFGFGIVSGIDLPGEARGEVRKPSEFREATQEFMAFGYQLAVTPLQLLSAYATVANNGVMMKPHLLKRRLDRDGNIVEEIEPQEIRRVISREVADTLSNMLVGVVEHGTGSHARIPGMRVAGKTGTAQQIDGGEYSRQNYNASFVGFFPADAPRVALLVLLDKPTNGYYGGQVAAPIFREIARRIAGVAPVPSEDVPTQADADIVPPTSRRVAVSGTLRVPDLRGADIEAARALLEQIGLRPLARGDGDVVIAQSPAPNALIDALGVVTVGTADPRVLANAPDLRGLSLRRAINLLNAGKIHPHIVGHGVVTSQSPPPGGRIGNTRVVELRCSPSSAGTIVE